MCLVFCALTSQFKGLLVKNRVLTVVLLVAGCKCIMLPVSVFILYINTVKPEPLLSLLAVNGHFRTVAIL